METWKPVPGYPGYEISDMGRARSIAKVLSNARGTYTRPSQVLVPFITPKGYVTYSARREGKYTRFLAHRAIYGAFVGSVDGVQVRHRNGVPSDNRIENLTVGSNADNQRDSVEHGTHHMARKTHCKNGHEFTPANTAHYTTPKGGPGRRCRACHRARMRHARS